LPKCFSKDAHVRKTIVATVHGKFHTYKVVERPGGMFSSPSYYIMRNDGKTFGSYSTRADAVRAAHEKAGPGAYES